MSDLEQYLNSEAGQGLFQGVGEFQLSPREAMEKLGRFVLPEPGFWVLKMVQAAVATGAEQISFTFSKRKVEVRFPNVGSWEAEVILRETLSGGISCDLGRRHLAIGLLGAATGFTQKISWSCGSSFVSVDKEGPSIEENTAAPEVLIVTATRPRHSPVKPSKFTSPVRYLLKQTAHEYKALIERCKTCPISLTVDGYELPRSYQKSVDGLVPIKRYNSENATGRGVMLAQLPLRGTSRANLRYPIDGQSSTPFAQEYEKLVTFRPPFEGDSIQAVLGVYSCLQRVSSINFVSDGVVLERDDLYSYPTLHPLRAVLEDKADDLILDLYLGLSENDVDLSGFGVKKENIPNLLPYCAQALLETIEFVRRNAHLEWDLSKTPPLGSKPWAPSVAEIFGGAFLLLFIPHMLAVGGLCGACYLVAKPISALLEGTFLADKWEEQQARTHHKNVDRLLTRLNQIALGLQPLVSKHS